MVVKSIIMVQPGTAETAEQQHWLSPVCVQWRDTATALNQHCHTSGVKCCMLLADTFLYLLLFYEHKEGGESWEHADWCRGRDRNVVNWFFCRPNILNFSSRWWTEEIRISRGVITRKYSETLRPSAAGIPNWAQLCCQCEIFQIQYCLQNFFKLRRSTGFFACFPNPSPMFLLRPCPLSIG